MKPAALILLLLLAPLVVIAQTTSVSLAWDASPDEATVGYAIYYGASLFSLATRVDVGNVTSAVLPNIPIGTTYFAVSAYVANGSESDLSNVISFTWGNSQPRYFGVFR